MVKCLLRAATLVSVVAGAIGSSAISASAVTCSAAVAGKVTGTSGCELGDDNNDDTGGGTLDVNTHSLFGFTDWIFQGKDDGLTGVIESPSGTTNPLSLVLSGGGKSGTWSVAASAFTLFENIMLVFKGPNSTGTQPDRYVGYLLSTTSGVYATLFAKNGNAQDINHVSIYARGEPKIAPIPLPASLPLLLVGLSGLAFLSWRRLGWRRLELDFPWTVPAMTEGANLLPTVSRAVFRARRPAGRSAGDVR